MTNANNTTYIVSRHPATVEWIRNEGFSNPILIEHFTDSNMLELVEGDIVIGNLPLSIISEICEKNVAYYNISFENLSKDKRGRELALDEIIEAGINIKRYLVLEVL